METISNIRRRRLVNDESISTISRSLNLSRNTVKKYLNTTDEPRYQRQHQIKPKVGEFQTILEIYLKQDYLLPKSRRRTARRLFEGLQVEGYNGAYDSIQRFVKAWKANHCSTIQPTKAFAPLTFKPIDTSRKLGVCSSVTAPIVKVSIHPYHQAIVGV